MTVGADWWGEVPELGLVIPKPPAGFHDNMGKAESLPSRGP